MHDYIGFGRTNAAYMQQFTQNTDCEQDEIIARIEDCENWRKRVKMVRMVQDGSRWFRQPPMPGNIVHDKETSVGEMT